MLQKITWDDLNQPSNNILAPAYKSNGHVFTSGCVGIDHNTGEVSEDAAIQTEIAIKNLQKVLEVAGSSLEKVVKVLLFIKDPSERPKINEVYAKYFTSQPARSCVVVGFPNPKLKVELEAVAQYE